MPSPQPNRQIDGRFLPVDWRPPLVGIGVGEVGREAEIIEVICLVSSSARAIGSTSAGSRLRKNPS